MLFNKKTWKDRKAEFINRRTITYNDGSSDVITVDRNEGNILDEGDAFNAENMNGLENRISETFQDVENLFNEVDNSFIEVEKKSKEFDNSLGAVENIVCFYDKCEDVLDVDFNDFYSEKNRRCFVDQSCKNVPNALGKGIRDVIFISNTEAIVRITGVYSSISALPCFWMNKVNTSGTINKWHVIQP